MKTTDKFVFFWNGIFSNWNPAKFLMYGNEFANSEQAFMWLKARFFNDEETAAKILLDPTPDGVKALGRLVKNYDDAEWSLARFEMMYKACNAKFRQDPNLAQALLATGTRILVEASPYDKVWGIGMGENEAGIEDKANWKGLNLLGEVLMKVRENLHLTPIE